MDQQSEVNPHYLDHVIDVGRTREVEASEDIYSGNGTKLLAKGARIDDRVKDQLLQHKLSKPLEDCMRVAEGVDAQQFLATAERLLDRSTLLRSVFRSGHDKALQALRQISLSPQMQSLLTVYAEHRPKKLEHTVGVALLNAGMTLHLQGTPDMLRTALLAGLCHDIGELYIDPAFLERGSRLPPHEWKHIAAHPVIAFRVLHKMPGLGEQVCAAVVHHHERLDGFGYPRGLRGKAIPLAGQVLAAAELLSGLNEAGPGAPRRADVAMKLIPGEFHQSMIDLVATMGRDCNDLDAALARLPKLEDTVKRAEHIGDRLNKLTHLVSGLDDALKHASAATKDIAAVSVQRFERIRRAFSSTGLDTGAPRSLLSQLVQMEGEVLHLEVHLILGEIAWRLRELEREVRLRVQTASPQEGPLVERLLAPLLLRADAAAPAEAAA